MAEENAVNSGDFAWQLGTAQATPRKAPAVLTLETDHTMAMSSRKGARAGGEKGATWVQE